MRNITLSIIGALCLLGCASAPLQKQAWSVIEHDVVDDRNYTLGGNPITAPVGSPMIKRRKYEFKIIQYEGFVAPSNNVNIKWDTLLSGGEYSFSKGQPLPVSLSNDDGINYTVITSSGLVISPETKTLLPDREAVHNDMTGKWWLRDSRWQVTPPDTKFLKSQKTQVQNSGPYINYEIVYSGINGKTINLLYREYDREDFAKTAFFQNLSYTIDDTEPTMIRFRDLEIKVTKAGNEGVEFTVIKDDSIL